jgi:hypothetical protein
MIAGAWQTFRSDVDDLDTARDVARASLETRKSSRVWYRREDEPDSATRPF